MLVLRIKGRFEHEDLLTVRCKEITGFTFRPRLCFLTYAAVLRGRLHCVRQERISPGV